MSLPKVMKAIIFRSRGSASIESIPLPPLRPTHLLIKVNSVALNPTDWKCVASLTPASPFSIVGCDYAGTVISIGPEVTKPFKIGDKVYGCGHGSNTSQGYDGVFAEYAMVKGDVTMHVPTDSRLGLSLEDLATVPLGSITVGQGLFQQGKGLELASPESGEGKGEWLFISGGASATGSLAIQLAKLAGYKVITTSSPRNFDFVKSRGADEVFDYNNPDCGPQIRALTGNKLKYAWDTVGWDESKTKHCVCAEALSSDSSICRFGGIASNNFPRKDVKQTSTLMYTMFGEAFHKFGREFTASKEDYEFAKAWMALTEKLVADGKLKPHPKRVSDAGFEGVLKGMEELKNGKVRGEKLVYQISKS